MMGYAPSRAGWLHLERAGRGGLRLGSWSFESPTGLPSLGQSTRVTRECVRII